MVVSKGHTAAPNRLTKTCLKKAYKRAVENTRNELLYNTKKDKNKDNTTSIIMTFSNQHSKIRTVIQKYWHLLYKNPRFVSKTHGITFRRATSIKDRPIQSEFKGELRWDLCKYKGTYTCGGCSYCKYIYTGSSCRLPNWQMFKAEHFANCKTCGEVYLISVTVAYFMWGRQKLNSGKGFIDMFGSCSFVTLNCP